MKRIAVQDKLGIHPGTSKQAAAFLDLFMRSRLPWILDFTGVQILTPQFLEGFFGKLAESFGPELFQKRLTWVNLEASLQRELFAFLRQKFDEYGKVST